MISVSLKKKLWMYDAGNDCKFEIHKENYHGLQSYYPIYTFDSFHKIKVHIYS